jgi:hypothetical protein
MYDACCCDGLGVRQLAVQSMNTLAYVALTVLKPRALLVCSLVGRSATKPIDRIVHLTVAPFVTTRK